jgi:hypothetical protein
MKSFYSEEVNTIWLGFLTRVSRLSKKINMWFMIPTLVLYIVIAGLATWLFPDMMLSILLFMIVLVVASNMIQSRIVNNKVREENRKTQDEIRAYIGEGAFDELVKAQEAHYQEYFKFDEEPVSEETPLEEVEKDGENDESKSN